jgi:release factor glutamine methyltransferase
VTTAREALLDATGRLAWAAVESPRVDAEFLLAHVLGTTRSELHANGGRTLAESELSELEVLVARREAREPLAYVLGEWGFRRLTLTVDRRVLVPRLETEVVVERALAQLAGRSEPRILDVGTGSGAIALAIADEHPGALVTGIDASADALEVARENAGRTGLSVELALQDLRDGLPEGPWDLIVCNPPYVRADELARLEPEVREWEPRAALVGERATEQVARSALDVLLLGGVLVLETAGGGAEEVANLLRSLGYEDVRVTSDLTRRSRVAEGVAPGG